MEANLPSYNVLERENRINFNSSTIFVNGDSCTRIIEIYDSGEEPFFSYESKNKNYVDYILIEDGNNEGIDRKVILV